ncbi:MAG: N-6 DNA methylase [Anaerolineae bacterium]|nr:N-6 DNA methylase [Anaerolineae bacterium]
MTGILIRTLRDDIYPAMLEAAGDADRLDVLRCLQQITAARIGEQRGLVFDLNLPDIPRRVQDYGFARLLRLDCSTVDDRFLGRLYGELISDRHEQGSYYTPPQMADRLTGWTISPLLNAASTGKLRILDPAMGCGDLLLAAAATISGSTGVENPSYLHAELRWSALEHLYGIDRDPAAVEVAALTLWLWAGLPGTSPRNLSTGLIEGDSLLDDLDESLPGSFDAVIGNPPFASVFTRSKSEDDNYRDALREDYETTSGSFDLAVPFVERAVQFCRPGGRIGLVLPNKILAASYAGDLRRWLIDRVNVEIIADYSNSLSFDADVYPVVLVMQRDDHDPTARLTIVKVDDPEEPPWIVRSGEQADLSNSPGDLWSAALAPDWDVLRGHLTRTVPLDSIAALNGGLTVDEAYQLRDKVVDVPINTLPADSVRLLTSGLIRRHGSWWGIKNARYLKRSYRRPVVMCHALPERRREQANTHKIIVSGLSRRPEAVVDRGLAQASVSTTILTGTAWPIDALCALLNSSMIARLTQALFGALALSGGYLRLGKRELGLLPVPDLPPDDPRMGELDSLGAQMAVQVARGDRVAASDLDEQIDRLVERLYGVQK